MRTRTRKRENAEEREGRNAEHYEDDMKKRCFDVTNIELRRNMQKRILDDESSAGFFKHVVIEDSLSFYRR